MKIALIGATGRVGKMVLADALARGHTVTAIVRDPSKVKPAPNLTLVKGDIYHPDTLEAGLKGQDALISTFNPGWTDPEIRPNSMKGTRGLVTALRKFGPKRALFVGGAGSLLGPDGKRGVDSEHFPAAWKEGALGAADALDFIRTIDDLDWTFVSPAMMLNPGEKTGKYRYGLENPVIDDKGGSHISEGDLAHAIVSEIEAPKHIRKRFTIGY